MKIGPQNTKIGILGTILLLLMSTHSLYGQSSTQYENQKNLKKKIEYDVNKDGKIDRVETYENGILKILELDIGFNGNLNSKTTYFNFISTKTPIEKTEVDKNLDGKIDTVETIYKNDEFKKYITVHEIDSKFTGTFDKKFNTQRNISEKKDIAGPNDCDDKMNLNDLKILNLSTNINQIQSKITAGFSDIIPGYRIHESCLNKWGKSDFPTLLSKSIQKGLLCLADLAQKNTKENNSPNGALNILKQLEFILTQSKVSITCNQKNYDWTGTKAHASVSPNDKILEKDLSMEHPFISINPTYPKNKIATSDELADISNTLFHEQLHNLGIKHGEDIEYPYTCATCCLTEKKAGKNEAEIADACRICAGSYSGANDKNYLRDLVQWGKSSYKSERAVMAILNYQKEFKKDRWALILSADAHSDIFSPMGLALSSIIRGKFQDLTEEEKSILDSAEEYQDEVNLTTPQVKKFSALLADAYIKVYYEADYKTSIGKLVDKKSDLKALLLAAKNATGNNKYIYESLNKSLDELISEIWMRGYPNTNTEESQKAYLLLKELGLR